MIFSVWIYGRMYANVCANMFCFILEANDSEVDRFDSTMNNAVDAVRPKRQSEQIKNGLREPGPMSVRDNESAVPEMYR